MRRILWIGCGLAAVQQATGINTVNYYAPTILESTGIGASAALILTITVGLVGIIGTILGIVLLGYYNRRPLLLTGFIGVAVGHAVLALSFLLPESASAATSSWPRCCSWCSSCRPSSARWSGCCSRRSSR